MTAEQRAVIEGVKAEWRAGEIQATALSLANSIVTNCRATGVPTCGVDGVRAWLARD